MRSLAELPQLGLGISGEYGNRPHIDPLQFNADTGLIDFVEYGSDLARGLDERILNWVAAGGAATYHFLDLNIEDLQDLDPEWLGGTRSFAESLSSPWICGDAGLWHFGPRDRGHGLLFPPILSRSSAERAAEVILEIQSETGLPVLPENPPSTFFLGELHILDYFARLSELADCGLLLDAAHLAIFQRARGLMPTTGLEDFPMDRVVESHVAGGGESVTADGYRYLNDDHRAEVHPDVWQITEQVIASAPNLKAVVYECEHNPPESTIPTFQRLRGLLASRGAR